MEVRLSYDSTFSAIILDEDQLLPNNYKVQINAIITTEDNNLQNIAMQRINFIMSNVFHNSTIINITNEKLIDTIKLFSNNHFVMIPDEPYDQIIGIMIYNKLTAITEGNFIIDNVIIGSELADNINYTVDELFDFEDEKIHWWDSNDLSTSDIELQSENIISWEDVGLGWSEEDEEDSSEIDNTPIEPELKKKLSIFVIDGGAKKLPKET